MNIPVVASWSASVTNRITKILVLKSVFTRMVNSVQQYQNKFSRKSAKACDCSHLITVSSVQSLTIGTKWNKPSLQKSRGALSSCPLGPNKVNLHIISWKFVGILELSYTALFFHANIRATFSSTICIYLPITHILYTGRGAKNPVHMDTGSIYDWWTWKWLMDMCMQQYRSPISTTVDGCSNGPSMCKIFVNIHRRLYRSILATLTMRLQCTQFSLLLIINWISANNMHKMVFLFVGWDVADAIQDKLS